MKWKNDRPAPGGRKIKRKNDRSEWGDRNLAGKIWIRRILLALAVIVVLGIAILFLFCRMGLNSLKKQAVTSASWEADAGENRRVLGDVVTYQGKEYRRNEEMYVILCMGLDTENDMVEAGGLMGTGAQSDANFLVVVDAATRKLRVIAIPRDTMTEIETFYADGEPLGLLTDHLALQYAYGDGGARSCELMQCAVSRLFYDLPIDAYVTFSLNSIESLNGMVGGVTVEIQEDFDEFKAGETVTLTNEQAYHYIRWRDCEEAYSAQSRLERQKQYLTAFIEKAVAATRQDITTPFGMYAAVSDSMLINLSDTQIFSLVLLGLACDFGEDSFYVVPGEQRIGSYYEEYYVDEEKFYEMMLDIFYVSDAT